jgi:S-adenosylmethionine-diacylgycerolhomoserine-N-methlytransferase
MSATAANREAAGGPTPIEGYYRWHAQIYDATRWSFLFGRRAILREVAGKPARILEVGCGTGKNLANLCQRYPKADVTGVDLSGAMLERARRKTQAYSDRVRLRQEAYSGAPDGRAGYDLVLFSYALTMFNPGFEAAIDAAWRDLLPGGEMAVVDFHDTGTRAFENWMGVNHVRMNGQLRPLLQARFEPRVDRLETAYGGLWRYLMFVGRKAG